VAVGSGGSLTAAHFAALLHRRRHLTFARAATPLELFVSEPGLGKGAALLLSASGKNRDILAALAACTTSGTAALATLCTRRNSPLAAAAKSYARSHVFEEDLPAGEEGLLATNSLLATAVLLARAYGYTIPDRFQDSPPDPGARAAFEGRRLCVVLHGGFGSPAAVDLETKLNEAALVPAQSCDYRNFGHGRQLWLSRCPGEVVVVAVESPDGGACGADALGARGRCWGR
jgi:glucosamine 6-phosphate synthetase-like amidotransferase/phosphosugar isomerase protein